MTRTRSHSLDAGGLNWDSLPMKLFAGGNAKFWNPADIDFSRDRADWESLSPRRAGHSAVPLLSPRKAVTQISRLRRCGRGRLADEMYWPQFAFEKANTPRCSGCGSTPSG